LIERSSRELDFTFPKGRLLSEPVRLFSTSLVTADVYTFTIQIHADLSQLSQIAITYQAGAIGVTLFFRFITTFFLFVTFCIVSFLIESEWRSTRPLKWSLELECSLAMIIFFTASICEKHYNSKSLFYLAAMLAIRIAFSMTIKISVLAFVLAARRIDSKAVPNSRLFSVTFLALFSGDFFVNCKRSMAVAEFDQLSGERNAMKVSFGIEFAYFVVIVGHLRKTWQFLDESQRPRFWISTLCIAFLLLVTVAGRLAEGFLVEIGAMMIPEIAIATAQFAFMSVMTYFHWPHRGRRFSEYAETEKEGLGGESLIE
jgi:hypothetical protein